MPDSNAPEYVLSKKNNQNKNLMYPSTLGNNQEDSHYMSFYIFSRGKVTGTNLGTDTFFDRNTKEESNPQNKKIIERDIGELKGTINLYFPNDLQTQYEFDYSDTETGIIGTIADAEGTNQAVMESIRAGQQRIFQGLEFVTGTGEQTFQKLFLGTIRNPRMEVIFRSPTFRTHQFQFEFYPLNEQETMSVHEIIKKFKYHAHPSFENNQQRSVFLYPDEFEIFLGNDKTQKYLFKIARSYLTSIQVNYAPMGKATFFKSSGGSTGIQLSLTFKETTILTKEDIERGY